MIKHIGRFSDEPEEGGMKISGVIKKIKCNKDIIHIHCSGIEFALKYTRINGKKIYSLYDNQARTPISSIKSWYYDRKYFNYDLTFKQFLLPFISSCIPIKVKSELLKPYQLIVPTHYLKRRLEISNAKVIPFGIDLKKFKPKKKKNDKLVISYIGAGSYLKGTIHTIKAFKKLMSEYPNITCRLYLPSVNFKDEKFLEGIEVYPKQKDIVKAYQSTDILVMPHLTQSSSIGIPLVLLEGMACGCAIVTTTQENIVEVAEDCVQYSKPNPTKLAQSIELLIQNEEYRDYLIKKSIKRIKKYNIKDMIKKYKEVYQNI